MADNEPMPTKSSKGILGLPMWVWLIIGGSAIGIGWYIYKSRKASATTSTATPTQADTSQTNDQPSGLSTDQYESLLALLRDIQGQNASESEEPEPSPIQGGKPPMSPMPPVPVPAPPPAPPPSPGPSPPISTGHNIVVRPGDTMVKLAQQHGFGAGEAGADRLYNYASNAQVIRTEAQKHGHKSDYPHWIYPGEVLHVP